MIFWRHIPVRTGRMYMYQNTVGVVGGGPAGMMAAITAARMGAQVTIFERNDRIGKKLLATGNGKCNLGNLNLTENEYYGSNKKWIWESLKLFDTEETIRFFQGVGLLIKNKNGYLYPLCEQAAVVLDVLRAELQTLGVNIRTECKINKINKQSETAKWQISDGKEQFSFDKIILACGSKAAPKTGSDGSGYKLANQLRHSLIPTVPALVQLKCREDYLKAVAGVRTDAKLCVMQNGEVLAEERGELQLTEYGISGIPVFQLSRIVNYLLREQEEVTVTIDLLPDFSEGDYERMQAGRTLLQDGRTVEEFFTGMLHKKMMMLFVKMAGLKPNQLMADADKEAVAQVFSLCREWTVHVNGSNPYDNAQVCAGGVNTEEITFDMESKKAPGIYFAGEILDVDGKCGGYNLQWAWCSGYLAGKAAAESVKKA